ncbi:MAG: glycine zipper 2TM domain-containing protein [Sulfuricellaceae bacterium]|nr:glycine zipper 2TM domain-containing protein [Sulfuricellaceae bacterium]
MKKLTPLVIACGLISGANAADLIDVAQVVSVSPIYTRASVPQQECWTEYAPETTNQGRSYGGAIVGGLAGGLIGHQVGGGRGKTAATVIGATTGAIIGDRIDNSPDQTNYNTQPVQRCRDTYSERGAQITGYSVTYRYNGRNITTTLPYNPGSQVRIGIGVIE